MKRGGASRQRGNTDLADLDREKLEQLEQMQEVLTDISIEELREFLEADLAEVPADPEFKERLRQKLWALVQDLAEQRGSGRTRKD